MFSTHAYLVLGPVLSIAFLFGLERHIGLALRWVVAALVVPAVLVIVVFAAYGTIGGMLYLLSVIPIYFVGLAFGWRCAKSCPEVVPCSRS